MPLRVSTVPDMLAGRGRVDRPRAGLGDVKGRAEQCEQQRHDLRAAPVIARTVGKRSHLETPTTTTTTTTYPRDAGDDDAGLWRRERRDTPAGLRGIPCRSRSPPAHSSPSSRPKPPSSRPLPAGRCPCPGGSARWISTLDQQALPLNGCGGMCGGCCTTQHCRERTSRGRSYICRYVLDARCASPASVSAAIEVS